MWTTTAGQLAAAVCVLCVKQWHSAKAHVRLELEVSLVYLFTMTLHNHPPPLTMTIFKVIVNGKPMIIETQTLAHNITHRRSQ